MKSRNLTYLGGIAALALVAGTVATHADIDATTDALAANSTGAMSVSCTGATSAVFVPAIAYTLTVAAPSRTVVPSATTHSISGSITNAVSSDSMPSVTVTAAGIAAKLNFWHTGAKVKVGGIQCTTNTQSSMTALGDAADDSNFDISMQGPSATSYSSGSKVDGVNTGSAVTTFGSSGTVATSAVPDNNDSEAATDDGEVTFGPGSTAAKGGYRFVNEYKYIGANPSPTETLTLTMTPS